MGKREISEAEQNRKFQKKFSKLLREFNKYQAKQKQSSPGQKNMFAPYESYEEALKSDVEAIRSVMCWHRQ